MKNNSELVNVFNRFCTDKDEYLNLDLKHKEEKSKLENDQVSELKRVSIQLVNSIDILISNKNFETTALEIEKKEILAIKEEVELRIKDL